MASICHEAIAARPSEMRGGNPGYTLLAEYPKADFGMVSNTLGYAHFTHAGLFISLSLPDLSNKKENIYL
jgi:hypothetical protein